MEQKLTGSDALDLGSYFSQPGFDWIIRNQRHAKFILCRILMANQKNRFLVVPQGCKYSAPPQVNYI